MSDPRPPEPEIVEWVRDLFDSFAASWTSGNVDTFAAHWTEDAIFWPPSGEELNGREAIHTWAVEFGPVADLDVEMLHVETLGETIFVVGNFTQDVTLQGAPVQFRGGFTGILQDHGEGLQVNRLVSFPERSAHRLRAVRDCEGGLWRVS